MIDFQNASYLKLRTVSNSNYEKVIYPLLVDGESVIYSFQGIRDGIVFTNKRVITINLQGMTGKKKDLTSLPYSKIQVFSIETAGVLDFDNELELWFSGLGKVKFEFTSQVDISGICKIISQYVL